MGVFRNALRVCLRHPVYLVVYVGILSVMGLFMAGGLNFGQADQEFSATRAPFTVIDRDGSAVSRAVVDFLDAQGEWVEVADQQQALQDAVATGQVDYLLIVPAGFGEDFLTAARGQGAEPQLEAVFSYQSASGMLVDTQVNQYLGLVRAAAALNPSASDVDVVSTANEAADNSAAVEVVQSPQAAVGADRFLFYLTWSSYPLTAAIVVSVGLVMGAFNRVDLRRRILVSAQRNSSVSLQKVAAGLLVTVAVWAVVAGLGLAVFWESARCLSLAGLVLALGAMLLLSLTPLAIAFLLGQLGATETVSNAVGNILGMVFTFFGGAWVSISLLPSAIRVVASFSPVYWYTNIVEGCAQVSSWGQALASSASSLGILLLFAAAVFIAALVAGRLRLQSATAGGNSAAARPR